MRILGILKLILDRFYNNIKRFEERSEVNLHSLPGTLNRSIQTDNYSCAVHCVKVILDFFDYYRNFNEILEGLGTTSEGTDTGPILKFLKNCGLEIFVNENASLSDIHSAIDEGSPVLITIDDWEHWVVVYGYSKDAVWIADSNKKAVRAKRSKEEFLERWDDNWIAVITKGIKTTSGIE